MTVELKRVGENRYTIPKTGGMRVPGLVFASDHMAAQLRGDQSLEQVRNVAHLPGIVKASIAMPDIHWGYGFPIGGVAAVDAEEGVVSPGGVGYDINCGVRLVATQLPADELKPMMHSLVARLFRDIPTGVGASDAIPRLGEPELKRVLRDGARWAVKEGFGTPEDLAHCEEGGCLPWAEPDRVSDVARKRGADQVGTLGSGNHFLEIDEVAEVFEPETAAAFGLSVGQIAFLVHSGSRGLGYQVCDDNLVVLGEAMRRHRIEVPDRQLACAPVRSEEGRGYLGAMAAAANFAWANRQVMQGLAIQALAHALGTSESDIGAQLVYDVCHNIAKFETHDVDGIRRRLLLHRKGATRAFGPGRPELVDAYKPVGQPVIIPGDMGRASYVLVGTQHALDETFGSSCHGAGRVMSRGQALKAARGRQIDRELHEQGVEVMARVKKTLAEEMPEAYKDVSEVVGVIHDAGISRKVVRLKPLGVIKG